jgi:hypothetical protein
LENTPVRQFPCILLITLAIAACTAPPREETAARPAPPTAAAVAAPAPGAEAWQVMDSHLESRVFRDGPMQKLGHDHLITSERLAGEIQLREPLTESRFTLRLPLDSLVVDDEAARNRAGGAFAAPVPDKDREATRRNMLGERLLDAARQGEMLLASESITGANGRYEARVRVSLAGREHVLVAPFSLTLAGGRLVAHADLHLTHADLGLEPFAVALGALRVRDDFEVGFTVEASRGK